MSDSQSAAASPLVEQAPSSGKETLLPGNNVSDRRVTVRVDTSANKGVASVQVSWSIVIEIVPEPLFPDNIG
jgi:hypothetical protein